MASNNSVAQSTSAASLTPAAMSLFDDQAGAGTLYFTAFLHSSGTTPCSLQQVSVQLTQ